MEKNIDEIRSHYKDNFERVLKEIKEECDAMNDMKGIRYDEGKAPIDLVPPEVILALAKNLHINSKEGGGKYERRNWERGMQWSKCYSALQRHLLEWQMGQDLDDESGQSHLWHALSNLSFLITYKERQIGTDDRPTTLCKKSSSN